ncbi:MAG: S1C family serine protease [Polyangiaceae bacterium]
MRCLEALALLALVTIGRSAVAAPTAPPSTPQLPDPNAPPPSAVMPPPPGPGESPASPPSVEVRRGLVAVEQGGRITGVGVVLGTDGRILSSLSAATGDDVNVKLPDGRTVRAKVGHRDKAMDLALLVLQSGRWTEGLRASEVDPANVSLRAVASTQANHATTVPLTLKGRIEARSKDGQVPLAGALDLELPKGATPLAGAPLIDEQGAVMGVFVRACRPAAAHAAAPAPNMLAPANGPARGTDGGAPLGKCNLGWVGAPVSWIRSFLVKTPAEATAPSPWLGIAGEPGSSGATSGVRVLAVAPQSPAEKAGLKGSSDRAKAHLIVAVDGSPVSTPEKLAEAIAQHAVGDAVKVMILEGEKLKEIAVTLKAAP